MTPKSTLKLLLMSQLPKKDLRLLPSKLLNPLLRNYPSTR
jgi:hypothetical protein